MKNKKFFNLDHAIRYLNESIIRFEGEPIYVFSIDSGRHSKNFMLYYYKVGDPDRTHKYILSDNSSIDMNPVPLGMLSLKASPKDKFSTGYIERTPLRQYKIGLSRGNFKHKYVHPKYSMKYGSSVSNLLLSTELRDTIMGEYPAYKEAYKSAKDQGNIVAFSRRFAVGQDDKLYYKALQVPVGVAKSGSPTLDDDAFFLKEVLEEDFKNANY